jgi:transposase
VVHRLLADGRNLCEIAAELGLSRNTVRRFARAATPEELLTSDGTGRRASILDKHVPYLQERWNSGCTNAAQLWQEIRARGYQGSRRQVRSYLARFRGSAVIPAPAPVPPKPKAVTAWIMTRPDRLADADKASLEAILAASAELAAVTASVRDFAAIMAERRGRKRLEPWITAALATGEPALRSFVTGLRADQDAITNGLSLPWSSGAVEGRVNRIKMLKRQMYGRASPGLLRRRVLFATNPPRKDHGNCARARILTPWRADTGSFFRRWRHGADHTATLALAQSGTDERPQRGRPHRSA